MFHNPFESQLFWNEHHTLLSSHIAYESYRTKAYQFFLFAARLEPSEFKPVVGTVQMLAFLSRSMAYYPSAFFEQNAF